MNNYQIKLGRVLTILSAFVFSILIETPMAKANFSNYNSILIGDQAAGMGGAYTAMSEDASAMAWYNPAATALLKGQAFSGAVGIYKKFDTLYNSQTNLVQASLKANQGFFRPIPSSTGNIVRFKNFLTDWTFGLSIVVPQYDSFKGEINNGANNNVSSLNMIDESLWVGGSAATRLNSTDSFGFTYYYTARNYSQSVTDRTYVSASDFKIFSEDKTYSQNAMVLLLGYHRILSDTMKFGLSYRLPGLSVSGLGTYSSSTITPTSATPNNLAEIGTSARIPSKLAVGIAYDIPDLVTWAIDLNYYPAYSYSDVDRDDISEKIEHKEIVNLSIGGEYHWRKWMKFRAGLFSNLSSHPDPDPAKVHQQGDHVDQVGFSANSALISGNIQYTFGGYYVGGYGRSVQRINQTYQVVPKAQQVFTMLVGTTYIY